MASTHRLQFHQHSHAGVQAPRTSTTSPSAAAPLTKQGASDTVANGKDGVIGIGTDGVHMTTYLAGEVRNRRSRAASRRTAAGPGRRGVC